jgi:hypothetical protein
LSGDDDYSLKLTRSGRLHRRSRDILSMTEGLRRHENEIVSHVVPFESVGRAYRSKFARGLCEQIAFKMPSRIRAVPEVGFASGRGCLASDHEMTV